MSYEPSAPTTNAELTSLMFRNQFQGLATLIAAVQSIIAAQVDGVNTLSPGDPANASVTVTGNTLHFTFAIPRGDDGGAGAAGAQGPPFANAIVDAVNSLAPGTPTTVSVSFDGTNVHFTFGISTGDTGGQGIPGTDGAPGEVSNAQLTATVATAVSGTSSNTNAVATLDTAPSDPSTFCRLRSPAREDQ